MGQGDVVAEKGAVVTRAVERVGEVGVVAGAADLGVAGAAG